MFCQKCGMENENGSKFCNSCGSIMVQRDEEGNVVNKEQIDQRIKIEEKIAQKAARKQRKKEQFIAPMIMCALAILAGFLPMISVEGVTKVSLVSFGSDASGDFTGVILLGIASVILLLCLARLNIAAFIVSVTYLALCIRFYVYIEDRINSWYVKSLISRNIGYYMLIISVIGIVISFIATKMILLMKVKEKEE